MEKYGFVYIWFDKKKKMYYIGCHFGNINDGYICSSDRMRKSYQRRSKDFKRRILKTNIITQKETLLEEYRYLQMINKEELSIKYYNKRNHHFDHWSADDKLLLTTSERISIKTKEAMNRPDVKEKFKKGLKTRDTRRNDIDVAEKIRIAMIGKNAGKDNSKAIRISAEMRTGVSLSKEHKQKIKNTTIFKTLNNLRITCMHCGIEGNPGNIGRYHNEKCKTLNGRS